MSTKRRYPFIQVDNIDGVYYTPYRLYELIHIAEEIGNFYEASADFHVYYDSVNDYHCLSFYLSGDKFVINYYKVFAMSVNGCEYGDIPGRKNFGHSSWALLKFVKSSDFLNWSLEGRESEVKRV